MARTLRAHRPLLLNWFRAKGAVSAGTVEGFNNKAKLVLPASVDGYGLGRDLAPRTGGHGKQDALLAPSNRLKTFLTALYLE